MGVVIPEEQFDQLGVDVIQLTTKFKTLEELKNTTPGMVIARATKDFSYSINRGVIENMYKDKCYVMSFFLYQSLRVDMDGGECLCPAQERFGDKYNPYYGQDLTASKLLIWRSGGIGDLLFIQPHLRYLKNKYPDCHISFATSERFLPLVRSWDCVDESFSFPMSIEDFNSANYHLTFEGAIERTEEAENVNCYEVFGRWMGIDTPISDMVPVLNVDPDIESRVQDILESNNIDLDKLICVQVRTSAPIRTPPSEFWQQLLGQLLDKGYYLAFTDSPENHYAMNVFLKMAFKGVVRRSKIVNFCEHSINITYSAALAKLSKLVIAPDSSLIHIAAAVGTPAFGIYGPFPGSIRMSTYQNSKWIEPNLTPICEYSGKYCCIHGHLPCPSASPPTHRTFLDTGSSPCFDYISPHEAEQLIIHMLEGK